jgi:hypothetical protein
MAPWARRNREAATIFIAPVICWVDRTLRMRFRRSFKLGIAASLADSASSLARIIQQGAIRSDDDTGVGVVFRGVEDAGIGV